jgi:ubiquinone/menaquinone biosynthesis C-methylase UbiE
MKLNPFEFALMNNLVRAASQRWIEAPLLIGRRGVLAGQRVLEIGCGRGVGLEILLDFGAAEVMGLDIDPNMIRMAQERLADTGGRTQSEIGDAEAIQAPDASFDSVFDFGVLHHVPEWPKALREIARVLKPGGIFCFEDILRGLTTMWPARILFDHPQASQFSGGEFRLGLEEAGLKAAAWRQWGEWAVMGRARRTLSEDARAGQWEVKAGLAPPGPAQVRAGF